MTNINAWEETEAQERISATLNRRRGSPRRAQNPKFNTTSNSISCELAIPDHSKNQNERKKKWVHFTTSTSPKTAVIRVSNPSLQKLISGEMGTWVGGFKFAAPSWDCWSWDYWSTFEVSISMELIVRNVVRHREEAPGQEWSLVPEEASEMSSTTHNTDAPLISLFSCISLPP